MCIRRNICAASLVLLVGVMSPVAAQADASTTPSVPVATTTPPAPVASTTSTTPETATVRLWDGVMVGSFSIELPSSSTVSVSLNATGSSDAHSVPARSVLALLTALDMAHAEFAISNLQYFDSFGSFLINCIAVPSVSATPDCYNWTYAVNGTFPFAGMDTYSLAPGDTADVFFGSQWRVAVDKSALTVGESLVVTAEEYNPTTGVYGPATGEKVGAVQFDTSYIAHEFATSTADSSGHATLTLSQAGTYSVGIASSGYFPNVSVTAASSTASSTPAKTGSGGGSGGGGGGAAQAQFNVPLALGYLTSKQQSDGSFGSLFLSDWAAIAFAADSSVNTALRNYLLTAPALGGTTDYERHSMALMALGINPYTGTARDYIAPIVSAFDGTQIGDAHQDNDDIFALIPLLHAGYSASDNIIKKTTAYIVATQMPDGSWDSSVDMTAAAVQALSEVSSLPGVSSALSKARTYLHAQQQGNGGFSNSFSTSWTLQAIASLGDASSAWARGGLTGVEYLASLQQSDGGVELASASEQNRIWATAYAIPAALGKTWSDILRSFDKPSSGVVQGGTVLGVATSTLPLPPAATTTPTAATSTVVGSIVLTTTPTTAPLSVKRTVVKEVAAALAPLPVIESPIAVADAPSKGLFARLWGAIVGFFTYWL